MQAIILAAGLGKRLRPLTNEVPKPMIPICGKPLIDHVVGCLPDEIDEIILVVGYKKEQIIEHCREEFQGRKVQYVVQEKIDGMARALWLAKDLIKGKFLLMPADDIQGKKGLAEMIKHESSLGAFHTDHPERFGIVTADKEGFIESLEEKPEHPKSNLAVTATYVLQTDIFNYEPEAPIDGEYYMPEVVLRYAQDHPVKVVELEQWLPVGYPEHIEIAEAVLCPDKK